MWSAVVQFVRKLRTHFQRDRFYDELAEELSAHEAYKYREHIDAGLTPEEAARRTRVDMGNAALAADESADVRKFVAMEQLMHDTRYAFRLLRKNAGFSIVAVASLALGIGGSTAVFSILNALLIKPLPFGEPSRLVRITEFFPKALLVHLRQESRTMEIASVSPGVDMNVTGHGPAYQITGSPVSANLFHVLGTPARIGRTFGQGEDQPGRDRVAILSHDFWEQRFQSDPSVIGRVITVNGVGRTVVGVMPAGFRFPSSRVQIWLPAALDPRQPVDYWAGEFTPLIARVHAGVTIDQAKVELRSMVGEVWQMFPWPMPRRWNADATLIPLQTDLAGEARGRLLILLCGVAAVLVIACANVAGLLAARGAARTKEIAMRAALGAGRARIVRQLLTESLVLAAAAGGIGLALGAFAVRLFTAVIPSDLPGATQIGVDWNVAAFAVGLTVLTGFSFGVAPALTASRLNILGIIKAGGQRGATAASIAFRTWLIGAEIALTLALVIGATLLVRSLHRLSMADLGFEPQHVLAIRISPDAAFCTNPAACIAFYERTLREGRGIAAVVDTALANTVPFDGSAPSLAVDVEGHPKSADFPAPMFWTGAVTPDYFRLLSIPLLAGRLFSAADSRDSEPVVVVDAATARRYWPGESAVGKHVKWVSESRWRTIVGVVADVRQYNLANRTPAGLSGSVYLPYSQSIDGDGRIPYAMNLIVKTMGEKPVEELRRFAAAIHPDVPTGPVVRLDALVGTSAAAVRSTTWLFLAFASAALGLAAIGIYGLISYSVSQHGYDIAVRMAVGATQSNVVCMVLARSLRVALVGVPAGVMIAAVAVQGLSTMLYEVSPTDALVYAYGSGLMVAVVILASMIPAWRASRIDPVRVLRAE